MEISEPLMMSISVIYIAIFVIFANRFNKTNENKKYTNCSTNWMR
ncbi:MAG: hypothetical protein QG567_871 [Campylobacterota bacterium]|nr:hypothetical protein [Campylobacterota bacterium]